MNSDAIACPQQHRLRARHPHPVCHGGSKQYWAAGGSVFDLYFAGLACAWVADPANCSPFGRIQGVFSVAGEVGRLNAPTVIRRVP